jgi:hypothetical protein
MKKTTAVVNVFLKAQTLQQNKLDCFENETFTVVVTVLSISQGSLLKGKAEYS